MEVGDQHHAPAAFTLERLGTHCTGGWVGLGAGLDRCGKSRPHRDSIPGPFSPYRVAIPSRHPGSSWLLLCKLLTFYNVYKAGKRTVLAQPRRRIIESVYYLLYGMN
jgi:hypothetical protein